MSRHNCMSATTYRSSDKLEIFLFSFHAILNQLLYHTYFLSLYVSQLIRNLSIIFVLRRFLNFDICEVVDFVLLFIL